MLKDIDATSVEKIITVLLKDPRQPQLQLRMKGYLVQREKEILIANTARTVCYCIPRENILYFWVQKVDQSTNEPA